MVIEVRVKQKNYSSPEILSNRYYLKRLLRILCFIKNREIHELKTNRAIIIKVLSMNDKVYAHLVTLGKDGMIVRDKKKIIALTKQGEDTIKKASFQIVSLSPLTKNCSNYTKISARNFVGTSKLLETR